MYSCTIFALLQLQGAKMFRGLGGELMRKAGIYFGVSFPSKFCIIWFNVPFSTFHDISGQDGACL